MRTATMGLALAALTALTACGVDGPPERPTVATTTNINAGSNGVHTGTEVKVISGRVTMGVGLGL